ncbi:hypothetical protein JCM3765_003800 [Sporobolomyces pararoseus]
MTPSILPISPHYLFLPSLHTLSIIAIRPRDRPFWSSTNTIPYVPYASLTQLYLDGPTLATTGAAALSNLLPNLTKFFLKDSEGDGRLLDLVHVLPNPSKLEHLSLDYHGPSRDPSSPKYSPQKPIRRFSNLRSHSVNGRVDLRSSTFWTDVESVLHLRSLRFGYGTELSASKLCRLVGVLHLEQLEINTLSAFTSEQEAYLWSIFHGTPQNLTHTQFVAQTPAQVTELGINRPSWTEDFSRDGFRKLEEKCQEKGVTLQGMTQRAFELEDRYDSGELRREWEEKRKRCIEKESEVGKAGLSAV